MQLASSNQRTVSFVHLPTRLSSFSITQGQKTMSFRDFSKMWPRFELRRCTPCRMTVIPLDSKIGNMAKEEMTVCSFHPVPIILHYNIVLILTWAAASLDFCFNLHLNLFILSPGITTCNLEPWTSKGVENRRLGI